MDGERAVAPVVVRAPCRVGLDGAVRGQHRPPRPLRADHPLPALEVLGQPAEPDAAVDGAGATHDLAARDVDRAAGRRARGGEGPVERPQLLDDGDAADGLTDRRGREVEVWVVVPGLDEQDVAAWVRAQAVGQDAPGRAGPDDDDVVHAPPVRCLAPAMLASRGLSPRDEDVEGRR